MVAAGLVHPEPMPRWEKGVLLVAVLAGVALVASEIFFGWWHDF